MKRKVGPDVGALSVDEYKKLKKSGHKFGARMTEYNGKMYHSAFEANYAKSLDMAKSAVHPDYQVENWISQVPFECRVNGVLICKLIVDFKVIYANGRVEYVDTKSKATAKLPDFRIKKKLVEALYGIKIKIVMKK